MKAYESQRGIPVIFEGGGTAAIIAFLFFCDEIHLGVRYNLEIYLKQGRKQLERRGGLAKLCGAEPW